MELADRKKEWAVISILDDDRSILPDENYFSIFSVLKEEQ